MAANKTCRHVTRSLQSTFLSSDNRLNAIPTFLLPAFANTHKSQFSTTPARRSKIGRVPLTIPPGVTFAVKDSATISKDGVSQSMVEVVGPLGSMSMSIPPFIQVSIGNTEDTRVVSIADKEDKHQKAMWGNIRAYLQNHILGVSEGHTAILRLVGVGYRATVDDKAITKTAEFPGQKFVSLKVGYSHPIELPVPQGVKASTPQPTRILLEGVEKRLVMEFAANIREWRKPEPYKGKGIFVNGETIKLKAKKIK